MNAPQNVQVPQGQQIKYEYIPNTDTTDVDGSGGSGMIWIVLIFFIVIIIIIMILVFALPRNNTVRTITQTPSAPVPFGGMVTSSAYIPLPPEGIVDFAVQSITMSNLLSNVVYNFNINISTGYDSNVAIETYQSSSPGTSLPLQFDTVVSGNTVYIRIYGNSTGFSQGYASITAIPVSNTPGTSNGTINNGVSSVTTVNGVNTFNRRRRF